jgi:peptidoglycan/LPS O-acetylase OafA/YrhL
MMPHDTRLYEGVMVWLTGDSPLYALWLMVWVYACMRVLVDVLPRRCVVWLLPQQGHHASIDGLRGYLALAVCIHHSVIAFYAQHGHAWQNPPSVFYTLLGQVAVAVFFMITGFLFWQKALRHGGKLPVKSLYLGRVKRLTPAYAGSLVLMVCAAALPWGTHHISDITMKDIVQNVLLFKGFRTLSDINGVYWSLVWEWRFYVLLPLAAWTLRWWRGWGACIPVGVLMGLVIRKPEHAVVLYFVAGGLAVYGQQWWVKSRTLHATRLRAWGLDALVIAALAIVFACADSAYGWWQAVVLYVAFQAVVCGASLGGVLQHEASKILGSFSYSFYLLHCIVLYVALHTMRAVGVDVAQMDMFTYMCWLPWIVLVIGIVALVSFRVCEYPFLSTRPV